MLEDVDANLFALSWLKNRGVEPHRGNAFSFWGFFDADSQLQGVALEVTGRLAMLDVRQEELAADYGWFFGRQGIPFAHVVSRAEFVEPFWEEYSSETGSEARLIQEQELYHLMPEDFSFPRRRQSAVRRAQMMEAESIFLASVQMHREETLEDPLEEDAHAFRRHVRFRIEHGRTFAWFNARRQLMFKADISTRCAEGAQISGVFTAPQFRNQGVATRAMTDICALLLQEELPRLTLYVNQKNSSAIRVYERIGFRQQGSYQTIFIDD